MEGSINNLFALVLLYYDQFKRSKLASSDLMKIAKKYGTKPDKLVIDLTKKYGFIFPKVCKASAIMHICELYSVPDSYLQLMPKQFSEKVTIPYDPIYDIRSSLFDPEKVLTLKKIISPTSTLEMFDNLSKCKPLLSNFEGKVFNFGDVVLKEPKEKVKEEKTVPVLERIGADSCSDLNYIDDLGAESLQMSPFALAHSLMKTRTRVRVVIRKRASVRGILVGYLRAFDKHFNLLLTDVDEEYVPVKTKEKGQERSEEGEVFVPARKRTKNEIGKGAGKESQINSETLVLRRFVPQLLIRGDSVILLSKFSRTNSTFSKIRVQLNAAHATFVASSAPNRAARRSRMNHEKGKLRMSAHLKDDRRSDQNIPFEDSKEEYYNRYSNDDIRNFIGDRKRRSEETRESDVAENNYDNRLEYDDFRNRDYGNDSLSSRMRYDHDDSNYFVKYDGSDRMKYDDTRGRYDDVNTRDGGTIAYDSIRCSNSAENMTRFDDIRYNDDDVSDTNRSMRGDQEYSVQNSYDDMRYEEYSANDEKDDVACNSPDRVYQGSANDHDSYNDQITSYQECKLNSTKDRIPSDHPHEGYQGSSSERESFRDEVAPIAQETLSDKAGSWYAKFANKNTSKDETSEAPLSDLDRENNNDIADVLVDRESEFPKERFDKKRPRTEIDVTNSRDSNIDEKDSLRGKVQYEEGNSRDSYTSTNNKSRKWTAYNYDDRKMELFYRADDDTNSRVRDVQSTWNDSRELHRGQGSSRYSSNNRNDNHYDTNKEYDRDRSYRRAASDKTDGRERDFSYASQSSFDDVRRGSSDSYHRYEVDGRGEGYSRQQDRGRESREESTFGNGLYREKSQGEEEYQRREGKPLRKKTDD